MYNIAISFQFILEGMSIKGGTGKFTHNTSLHWLSQTTLRSKTVSLLVESCPHQF